jgi:AcrR family transcriptional regulator
MVKKNEKENSVRKILEAALDEFQKKGFDGARVDEIASKAGVNKALIYYYFESKEKILEAIFEEMTKDFVEGKSKALTGDQTNNDVLENHLQTMGSRELMKDIVTVAFTESLKERGRPNYLFDLVDGVMLGILKEQAVRKGTELDLKTRISLFFFATMPEIVYIMLGEKLAKYFNVEIDIFEKTFKEVYKKVLIEVTK